MAQSFLTLFSFVQNNLFFGKKTKQKEKNYFTYGQSEIFRRNLILRILTKLAKFSSREN